MATRRRIGVRLATTEAARRQLMQPVVCWEKVWVAPENAPPNSSMKIYKWVKTDKNQFCKQFSDDEEEADEPLAPLPDEPEVVEGDEDMDQDEPAASTAPDTELPTRDVTETNSVNQEVPSEPQTKPPSPTPLALSLQQAESILAVDEGADILDTPFKVLDTDMSVNVHETTNPEDVEELDMSVLGPDVASFEGVDNLSQMDGGDALLSGPLMDNLNGGDPFIPSMEPQPSDQETTG